LLSAARMTGVGVFVIAGLLLFAIGLFMIGDRRMAFAKKFTLYTQFARVTGLQPGAIVRVAGARGGSVVQILPPSRPSEKFRVQLEIVEDLHQLVRTDSIATIETEGLVGGTFLGIGAGSDHAPPAPPDSTIRGKEPFAVADLLQQMSEAVTRVNATIQSVQQELESSIAAITETVKNANDLIAAVREDVRIITSAGARISVNAAEISDALRKGQGALGKLLTDDTLYERATSIAAQAEEIASGAREVVEQARKALSDFQSKEGPVAGLTTNLRQTMEDARSAMTSFADNMEALKHNFLFRGFFNDRGYFNLGSISPTQYRAGLLTRGTRRIVARVWLTSAVLFEPDPASPAGERLSDGGKQRLDSAIAPFLDRLVTGLLVVEGYAQQGTRDEQYLRSRARAATIREYLIRKFQLDPTMTGLMPMGSDVAESPEGRPWDGAALAAFLERRTPDKR
jgi:phospholipid/cholesterol/gamma-HCH transport system substrate-binding protein